MKNHPTNRALQKWLAMGGPARVDRHVEGCAQCQEYLDGVSSLDPATRTGLVAVTAPPTDLQERVSDGVDIRLRDEAAAGAFADLFAIGWDFLKCVIDPDPNNAPPHTVADSADESDGGPK